MEDEDQFEQVLGGQYGQMESAMGTDGYRSFVEARNAEAAGFKAFAGRHSAVADAIRVGTLVFALAMIPVIVFLWKWAINA